MKNHKYIAKIGSGRNARYFYTQEEYDAYKNTRLNRPHQRTPKISKTWYGATNTAQVNKGSSVRYDKNGRVRKKSGIWASNSKPIMGTTHEHIISSLAKEGVKGKKERKKKFDALNQYFEQEERNNKMEEAYAKRKANRKERTRKRARAAYANFEHTIYKALRRKKK